MPIAKRSTAALRAVAVLAAIVATLVVWAVEAPLLGIDLRARPPGAGPELVGPAAIAFAVLLAGLVAWGLLTVAAAVGLACMHLTAAAVLIPLLARTVVRR
jgi:hypothetical protein